MVKLEFTDIAKKELEKLSELDGYTSIEEFITNKILIMLVDNITIADIENTKKGIEKLQNDLNIKRQEIMLELKGEKVE